MRRKSEVLPALSGVRAIAAYLIFLHHLQWSATGPFGFVLQDLFLEFHVGVAAFFVLSGFLITYRYYAYFKKPTASWSSYFWGRWVRVYPLFFVLTLFFALTESWSFFDLWTGLTFFKGFSNEHKFSGIPQAWSLSVEVCFYLAVPFIFYFLRKRQAWLPFAVLPALGWGLVRFQFPLTLMETPHFVILYTFFGRVTEFMVGIFLALIFMDGRLQLISRSFPRGAMTWVGGVGFLGVIVAMSRLQPSQAEIVAVRHVASIGLFHPLGIFLNHGVIPLAVAVFYAGLLIEETWLQKLLGSKFSVLLGQSSYAFYLIHVNLMRDFEKRGGIDPVSLFIFLNLLSIFLFLKVEQPLHRLLQNRLPQKIAGRV